MCIKRANIRKNGVQGEQNSWVLHAVPESFISFVETTPTKIT
jgi:hypothetical protein